eukprot:747539-Hanusia_phi.AAC.2
MTSVSRGEDCRKVYRWVLREIVAVWIDVASPAKTLLEELYSKYPEDNSKEQKEHDDIGQSHERADERVNQRPHA